MNYVTNYYLKSLGWAILEQERTNYWNYALIKTVNSVLSQSMEKKTMKNMHTHIRQMCEGFCCKKEQSTE
jgi:hypothetical protein